MLRIFGRVRTDAARREQLCELAVLTGSSTGHGTLRARSRGKNGETCNQPICQYALPPEIVGRVDFLPVWDSIPSRISIADKHLAEAKAGSGRLPRSDLIVGFQSGNSFYVWVAETAQGKLVVDLGPNVITDLTKL
jgi:hypothetical protein